MLHRPPMRFYSSFILALAVVLALASREARAQTATGPSVTMVTTPPLRLEPSGRSADNLGANPHPNGVEPGDINFEDCTADLRYQFQVQISGVVPGYNLDVWAGTEDCSRLANRQAATSVCWPVIAPRSAGLAESILVNVRMQDIVSQVAQTSHTVSYAPANRDVCQLQTTPGGTKIKLYFFFEEPGYDGTSPFSYDITVDTRASDVQGPITYGVGDTVLIVNIPATADPSVQGWNVYCDPPPGSEGLSETVAVDAPTNNGSCPAQSPDSSASDALAGATDALAEDGAATGPPAGDDAGGKACGIPLNDAGVRSSGACSTSAVLVPGGAGATLEEEGGVAIAGGRMPVGFQYGERNGSKYLCGFTSGRSAIVSKLKDGYYYNLAVAAVDSVGNVGPLSNVVCGEPMPVTDFFGRYTAAGGSAGGAFCSAEGVGVPAGTSGLGVLTVASMVAIVRRRRRS